MKKCQSCGYNNTDIMNFCLECGNALANEPQMVVPLDSLSGQETGNQSEQATEVYEKETVVNNRFPPQQSVATFQQQPQNQPKKSNTKLYLAVGGGLFAIVMLVGVTAAGILIYTLQNQEQEPPSRPIVSNTPITDIDDDIPTPTPTPTPDDDIDYPDVDETPQATPDNSSDSITFPTPTTPTKRATYMVRSISGWQLSDIETVPLENFTIKTRGRIKMDGVKNNVKANGVKGFADRRVFKEHPTGALLMRTHYPDGKHSNIQPVTSSPVWQNYKDETGKIEFMINDNSPENNEGDFTITFKMDSIAK